MLLHPGFLERASLPEEKIHMESFIWLCVLASQELRVSSGLPGSWRGCQPAGTSEVGNGDGHSCREGVGLAPSNRASGSVDHFSGGGGKCAGPGGSL